MNEVLELKREANIAGRQCLGNVALWSMLNDQVRYQVVAEPPHLSCRFVQAAASDARASRDSAADHGVLPGV